MEFTDALKRRHMTRSFAERPVPSALLHSVLSTANRAPSAGNTQGVELLVLTEQASRMRFWELASTPQWRSNSQQANGLLAAPVIIVPISDPATYLARYRERDKAPSLLSGRDKADWPVPFWLVDMAFVVMVLLLGATNVGLSALFFWLHTDEQAVLSGLGIPSGKQTIGALALGYEGESAKPTSSESRARKSLDELIHFERW